MSAQEIQPSSANSLGLATPYIQPHQEHVNAGPSHYHPGNDYINAFTTYELPVPPAREQITSDFSGGQPSEQRPEPLQASHPSADDLPIRVPTFTDCPHKETLNGQAQVEEWIAARAMEFAFTKHGERKARKALDEDNVQQSLTLADSQVLRTVQSQLPSTMDPHLQQITDPIHENMLHQTLQSAIASGAPPSPTSHELESLAAATATQGQLGSMPLAGYSQMPLNGQPSVPQSESETRLATPTALSTSQARARGGPMYESIVEYRCCWSGTYRPRNYENKTGQKRQRAPSTKVGCKARFVIRKVNQTGEYNVTYYWQHQGHDPTDIDQVKRMRSNQLPAAIKEHLRKKQEEDSRRNREQRASARGGKSEPQSGPGNTQDTRGTKRIREDDPLQIQDDQTRWLHPTYRTETANAGTAHNGFSLHDSGSLYEAIGRGNGDASRSPMAVFDPRLGAVETTTADRAFDEFTLNRGTSQTEHTVSHVNEPLATSVCPQAHPHADAQHQHQQMLALIPAPKVAGSDDMGNQLPPGVQHQAVLGSPLAAVSIGPRYHQSQQQLSDLRTPTTQTYFGGVDEARDAESLRQLAAEIPVPALSAVQVDATMSLDSAPISVGPWEQLAGSSALAQVFNGFRESLSMSMIQVHEALNALEPNRLSNEQFHSAGTEGLREDEIRAEMLGIVRLGQELAQRVQTVSRRVSEVKDVQETSGTA